MNENTRAAVPGSAVDLDVVYEVAFCHGGGILPDKGTQKRGLMGKATGGISGFPAPVDEPAWQVAGMKSYIQPLVFWPGKDVARYLKSGHP